MICGHVQNGVFRLLETHVPSVCAFAPLLVSWYGVQVDSQCVGILFLNHATHLVGWLVGAFGRSMCEELYLAKNFRYVHVATHGSLQHTFDAPSPSEHPRAPAKACFVENFQVDLYTRYDAMLVLRRRRSDLMIFRRRFRSLYLWILIAILIWIDNRHNVRAFRFVSVLFGPKARGSETRGP